MQFHFAECQLDAETHVLTRDGQEVHVEPQVFDVLHLLAQRAGAMVSYDDLIETVWNGRIVSDLTIAARISAARKAVGDNGKRQAIIQTVARRGIRFVVTVDADRIEVVATPEQVAVQTEVRVTASSDGVGIAWSAMGSGAPLLRAGHWLTHLERDLSSVIWGPWIERLSRNRRLVRYDPRGTGMSTRDCGPISVETGLADMCAVADAAGLERFSILAPSQSAVIAMAYAAAHPERVDRIITCGAFVQGSRVRDRAVGSAMTDVMGVMIRDGWGQPDSGYLRSLGALFMPGASTAELEDLLGLQSASASAQRAAEIRECSSSYDAVDLLRSVSVPVLVAHAMRDSVHPFSQAQLIAGHLADAQLLQLDTSNHILSPSEPAFEIFMQAVDRFLA